MANSVGLRGVEILEHRYLELKDEILMLEFILDQIKNDTNRSDLYTKSNAVEKIEKQIAEKYIEFDIESEKFYNSFVDVRDISLGETVEYKTR